MPGLLKSVLISDGFALVERKFFVVDDMVQLEDDSEGYVAVQSIRQFFRFGCGCVGNMVKAEMSIVQLRHQLVSDYFWH